MKAPFFYTLPPSRIPYPFILINGNNPRNGLRYIMKHQKVVQSVIIDTGIEIFRNPEIKDYPEGHLDRLLNLYHEVKAIVGDVFLVCPDYPDDYHPKSLWLSTEITNIERTFQNVVKCIEKEDINWLIPIQGHNEDPESILRSIDLYEQAGVLDKFDYFAIANLCVSKSSTTIVQTINLANLFLPSKKLHAFGISLRAVRKLKGKLYSWDSMAWTFPRQPGRWSAKNEKEREEYFFAYLQSIGIDYESLIGRTVEE